MPFEFWKKGKKEKQENKEEKKEEKIPVPPDFAEVVTKVIDEYGLELKQNYGNLHVKPIEIEVKKDVITITFLPTRVSGDYKNVDFKYGVDFKAEPKSFQLAVTSAELDNKGEITNLDEAGNLSLYVTRGKPRGKNLEEENLKLFQKSFPNEWRHIVDIAEVRSGQVLAEYDTSRGIRRSFDIRHS